MVSGVYAITNVKNGKVYVGSALNLKKRWVQHRSGLDKGAHANRHLQQAWKKYGGGAFTFTVLHFETEPKRLVDVEQVFMDLHHAADPAMGYNICPSARSSLGLKRSKETRARLSAAKKGKKAPEGTGAKISAALKGRPSGRKGVPHSQATKDQIRVTLRGRPKTEEHKKKIGRALEGRDVSVETRSKISASLKGREVSAETRAKMSVSRTGVPHPHKTKPAEQVLLVCVVCGKNFFRGARKERFLAKSRKEGPYCGVSCRNKAAAEKRHHGHIGP